MCDAQSEWAFTGGLRLLWNEGCCRVLRTQSLPHRPQPLVYCCRALDQLRFRFAPFNFFEGGLVPSKSSCRRGSSEPCICCVGGKLPRMAAGQRIARGTIATRCSRSIRAISGQNRITITCASKSPLNPRESILGSTRSASLAHHSRNHSRIICDLRVLVAHFRCSYLFWCPVGPGCKNPSFAIPNVTHSSRCDIVALSNDGRTLGVQRLERVLALCVKSSSRSLVQAYSMSALSTSKAERSRLTCAKISRACFSVNLNMSVIVNGKGNLQTLCFTVASLSCAACPWCRRSSFV